MRNPTVKRDANGRPQKLSWQRFNRYLNQFTLPAIDVGQWVAFYKALGLRLECEDWPSAMHAAVIAFVVAYLKWWNRNEGLPWMRANASVTVSASCM